MKLLTESIKKAAEGQFNRASEMREQQVVAKFFNPVGSWSWYLMNKDPESSYCWGIVKGEAVEVGSFDIEDLQKIELQFGLGIERDTSFTPMNAKLLYSKLIDGEHV